MPPPLVTADITYASVARADSSLQQPAASTLGTSAGPGQTHGNVGHMPLRTMTALRKQSAEKDPGPDLVRNPSGHSKHATVSSKSQDTSTTLGSKLKDTNSTGGESSRNTSSARKLQKRTFKDSTIITNEVEQFRMKLMPESPEFHKAVNAGSMNPDDPNATLRKSLRQLRELELETRTKLKDPLVQALDQLQLSSGKEDRIGLLEQELQDAQAIAQTATAKDDRISELESQNRDLQRQLNEANSRAQNADARARNAVSERDGYVQVIGLKQKRLDQQWSLLEQVASTAREKGLKPNLPRT